MTSGVAGKHGNLITLAGMGAKGGYVYMVTNKNKTVLYTGITSDLYSRIYKHKQGTASIFTARYKCRYLVYYEIFNSIEAAIKREKQIKKYPRKWKENLINSFNPDWEDLFDKVEGFH